MSFRGGRGGGRGGPGRGGGGRGRGGFDDGPPSQVCEIGEFMHGCEGELVCKLTNDNIPYFNAGIYLQNGTSKVGKVEEVLGPVNKVFFTVKCDPGVHANSFKESDKVYIGTDKLLPLTRFTNPPKPGGGRGGRGRGGGAGGGRGSPKKAFGRGGAKGGFGGRGPGGRGGPSGRFAGSGFSRGGAGGRFGGRGR